MSEFYFRLIRFTAVTAIGGRGFRISPQYFVFPAVNRISLFYLTSQIRDWRRYLAVDDKEDQLKMFRKHIETGRPLGGDGFITELKQKLGVDLKK